MVSRLRRPIESFNRIWLAVIALGVVFAVIAVTLLIGKLDLSRTLYRAEFIQAASIRTGDQVSVAGIQVGTVRSLKLAGDRVVVSFKADKTVHLGAETRAAIKLSTLLGSRYLELSPAPSGQLRDHTIPLANTAVPYDLQQIVADATTTFEQVDADRIAESVGTLARSLQGVPEALPQALTNLKSLSAIIANRREQLGTLLASTDTLTALIRNQRAALGSLVIQGRDLLGELATRRAAVQRLFASITTLVDRARTLLNDEPALNKLASDVADLSKRAQRNDALLRNIFQAIPPALRNFTNVTGWGMSGSGAAPAGPFIDAWMCALAGRTKQFTALPEYFQDCEPVPDPFPGFPPPYEPAAGFPGFPPATADTAPAVPAGTGPLGQLGPLPGPPPAEPPPNNPAPPPAEPAPGPAPLPAESAVGPALSPGGSPP